MIYRCEKCGSEDIESQEWVHLNSGTIVDGEGPSESLYCPTCEEHWAHTTEHCPWPMKIHNPLDAEKAAHNLSREITEALLERGCGTKDLAPMRRWVAATLATKIYRAFLLTDPPFCAEQYSIWVEGEIKNAVRECIWY